MASRRDRERWAAEAESFEATVASLKARVLDGTLTVDSALVEAEAALAGTEWWCWDGSEPALEACKRTLQGALRGQRDMAAFHAAQEARHEEEERVLQANREARNMAYTRGKLAQADRRDD